MKFCKLFVIIFLSMTFASHAQNVSESKFLYDYSMVRLDSSYDSKIDKHLKKYVDHKRHKMEKLMQVVVVRCDTELESYAPQSPLSNFLTDILRTESPKYSNDTMFAKIDVSLLNFGGIRTSMPAGDVVVGDLYRITPFDNYLTFILLKGSELKKALGRFSEKFNAPFSGAEITFQNGKATRILVHDEEIKDNELYSLVTLNFISDGGDHLLDGIHYEKIHYTTITFRDFLVIELSEMNAKGQSVNSTIDGRVKKI